jgi:ABC-type amino acid transport substrate-binding protein
MKKIIICVLLSTCTTLFSETLKVGYINSPPFAYTSKGDNIVVGTDVNLIRAGNPNAVLEFIKYDTPEDLINSFKLDNLNYGIGGISITTDRNAKVLFSMPTERNEITYIYDANKLDKHAMTSTIIRVLSKALLYLFIALTIIAHTIWLVERFNGDEYHFSRNYLKGIGQSYYWAVVVCSTVGFGDIVAKTPFGRFLTCLIIFGGIAWFGGFLGYMSMELGRIKDYNNFSIEQDFKAIGVAKNSTSERILNEKNILSIQFHNINECFDNMRAGKLDCVVYDKTPLKYLIQNDNRFSLGKRALASEFMGIICSSETHKKSVDQRIITNMH